MELCLLYFVVESEAIAVHSLWNEFSPLQFGLELHRLHIIIFVLLICGPKNKYFLYCLYLTWPAELPWWLFW